MSLLLIIKLALYIKILDIIWVIVFFEYFDKKSSLFKKSKKIKLIQSAIK